ncbi:unannotated protein [freshwater metagenome]|uniref:Unannotated protein n=1 Tax=freshwater metagenome TaxID=449393 RepID=A0A6J7JQL4_9ZZZZ
MVFSNAVTLSSQVVVVGFGRELYLKTNIGRQHSTIRETNALVPKELDRVAVLGNSITNEFSSRDWRAVRGYQVFRAERQEVIDSIKQDPWISIFLAADGKNIEQNWPHQVVDCDLQGREPIGDGVVRI